MSNVALVTGWDTVALVKAGRSIVETSTIAVTEFLCTDSAHVGILKFLLLLLTTSSFLVLRLLGIQALLAEGNLFWRKSFVGE